MIGSPSDDLAAQLERLFDSQAAAPSRPARPEGSVDVERVQGAESPPTPAPGATTDRPNLGQAVWDQLDKLRGQLDVAFEEVMGRIALLDLHVRTVGEQIQELGEAGSAAKAQSAETHELVQWLMATVEAAVAAGGLPIERGPASVDLGPVADMADLRKGVGALEDAVRSQGEGIEELRSSLAWIKERLLPH